MNSKSVVIDNGTGYKKSITFLIFFFSYTKMGWAGNPEPTYDIPTAIADHIDKVYFIIEKYF